MWFNPIVSWVLRSPFHRLLSGSMMLITVTGRRSGATYTTPVNYLRLGDELWTVSFRSRAWWRNLRGGGEAGLWLRGRSARGQAQVLEQPHEVAQALGSLVENQPGYARFLGVRRMADGRLDAETLAGAARDRVIVCTRVS